jgi:hypothetical protein
MGLPRVNETLNFTMTIPSSGKKVKYRPYLVKEEKILLQAFESKDTVTCLQAMCDTISSCLDEKEKVDVMRLATFDIEYMFTQLRSKSVGETSSVSIKCKECEHPNTVEIDLESLSVDVSNVDNIIKINKDISVELQYPTYKSMLAGEKSKSESGDQEQNMEDVLEMIASSLVAVTTNDERIDCRDESPKELMLFLDSMTAGQLQLLSIFFEDMPALKHTAIFSCKECGAHNELELKGLSDFF